MQFELHEAHRRVQAEVVALAERWKDRAAEIRVRQIEHGAFHEEFLKELCAAGLMGMLIPKEYGGTAAGVLSLAVALEALASKNVPVALPLLTNVCACAIAGSGSDDLRRRYLPRITTGETLFAFAFTEEPSGHNLFAMRTLARVADGRVAITGSKCFISGADVANRLLVVGRSLTPEEVTERKLPRFAGFNAAIVDPRGPGVRLTKMHLGEREGLNQWAVAFDQAQVPEQELVGKEHQGLAAVLGPINVERLLSSAFGLGAAEYVLSLAVARARERRPFGKPIGAYQAIQHPLAEIRARLEAARLLVYKSAAVFDVGGDPTAVGGWATMAKLVVADLLFRAVDQAIQTFGGSAYELDRGLVDLFLDARVFRTGPVSQELSLNFVAEHVLGLPPSG